MNCLTTLDIMGGMPEAEDFYNIIQQQQPKKPIGLRKRKEAKKVKKEQLAAVKRQRLEANSCIKPFHFIN